MKNGFIQRLKSGNEVWVSQLSSGDLELKYQNPERRAGQVFNCESEEGQLELVREILMSLKANTASLYIFGNVGKKLLFSLLFVDTGIGIPFHYLPALIVLNRKVVMPPSRALVLKCRVLVSAEKNIDSVSNEFFIKLNLSKAEVCVLF